VTVRFRPVRQLGPERDDYDLTDRQRRVLSLLRSNYNGLALRHIRAELGSGPAEWEVKNDLAVLIQFHSNSLQLDSNSGASLVA